MTYESSVSHVSFGFGQEHQRFREHFERTHQLCVELLHLSDQSSRTLVIWLGGLVRQLLLVKCRL